MLKWRELCIYVKSVFIGHRLTNQLRNRMLIPEDSKSAEDMAEEKVILDELIEVSCTLMLQFNL